MRTKHIIGAALAAVFAALAGPASAQDVELPTGIGLFITDTQQARWQLDNICTRSLGIGRPRWVGNFYDPPPCFGPNCMDMDGLAQKPQARLPEVAAYIRNTMKAGFVIMKVANEATTVPQVGGATAQAFRDNNVFGYHTVGPTSGTLQAIAVHDAFTTWTALKGLVIMPNDAFFAAMDLPAGDRQRLAAEAERQVYIDALRELKTTGSLVGKSIIYSPEQGTEKGIGEGRRVTHQKFREIADAVLPRTFWTKATKYGHGNNPHSNLEAKEHKQRKAWGVAGNVEATQPLILMAQTDMLRFLDEDSQPKARIHDYAKLAKGKKKPPQHANPNEHYYHKNNAIAVWEFAHMNLAEVEDFPNMVDSWNAN